MQRLLNHIIPFFLLGFAVVAFTFGIMLLAYLLFFGALVGLAIFIAKRIRDYFYPPKAKIVPRATNQQGRTFDSDDWKRL